MLLTVCNFNDLGSLDFFDLYLVSAICFITKTDFESLQLHVNNEKFQQKYETFMLK